MYEDKVSMIFELLIKNRGNDKIVIEKESARNFIENTRREIV